MLAVLRQRNFALLWFGQLISLVGDWVLLLALPFFVYELTGSTLATGGMFIALTLPRVALGSVAGVFVDRWDRRRTMIAADLARAAVLLLLLLVRSPGQVWLVYVAAFLETTISHFFFPAKNALLPRLVGEEQLVPANSLNSLSESLTRLVGPALGGVLFSALGIGPVVAIDSASFLVSGLLIALLTVPAAQQTQGAPIVQAGQAEGAAGLAAVGREWLEGLRLVARKRVIAVVFAIVGLAMVGEGILVVLLVPWTKAQLGGGSAELGWLLSAQAIGGLLGSLLVGRVGARVAPARLIAFAGVVDGLAIVAIANAPSLPVAMALIALAGLPAVGLFVSINALLQGAADDRFRGRVFGAFGTITALAQLVGMGLGGALGDRLGVVPMISVDGVLYVLAGFVALALLDGGLRRRAGAEVPRGADGSVVSG